MVGVVSDDYRGKGILSNNFDFSFEEDPWFRKVLIAAAEDIQLYSEMYNGEIPHPLDFTMTEKGEKYYHLDQYSAHLGKGPFYVDPLDRDKWPDGMDSSNALGHCTVSFVLLTWSLC